MNHDITPQEIKEHFHMIPLDQEGGVYCQTYISDEWLPEAVIPGRKGRHTVCSAILYLLSGDTFSRMHRLPTEEIFHFYLGDPVEMLQLSADGSGGMKVDESMGVEHLVAEADDAAGTIVVLL